MAAHTIFTIGHSTLRVDAFIAALKASLITAVADVRSAPYSRFNPGFNREPLKQDLKNQGLSYVFLGNELGGRPSDPSLYEAGRANYIAMAESADFKAGLDRVIHGSTSHRIALMCSEADPLNCHRMLLIARVLAERGLPVVHIEGEGRLEKHSDSETRLIRSVGLSESLLRGHDELLAEAYALQARRVAYVDRDRPKADAEAV